jgi:hypothetical protein
MERYDRLVDALHSGTYGYFLMTSKAVQLVHTLAVTAVCTGSLNAFFLVAALSWKYQFFGTGWFRGPELGIGLMISCAILFRPSIWKIRQCDLTFGSIIWKHATDSFQALRILRGSTALVYLFAMAFGLGMIAFSLRMDFYIFVMNMNLHNFCHTREYIFYYSYIEPMLEMLPVVLIIVAVSHDLVLAPIARKWELIVESSMHDQMTLDAIDKLTTLALYQGKLEKADRYSLLLLKLAEKTHSALV